jgi:hypothetical protein
MMERQREGREHERERTRDDREKDLSATQAQTLRDVQRFRIVGTRDLEAFRYQGRDGRMDADIRALLRAGLVYKHTAVNYRSRRPEKIEVLTETPKLQKPREVFHDAAIYPAYQRAAAKIERDGGRILSVRTDHQLKAEKARLTNRATPGRSPNSQNTDRRKQEIAEELHLNVIHGRTYVPDLQIQYIDRDGQDRYQNLEVVTDSYRSRDIGPKAAAGFGMTRAGGSTPRAKGPINDGISPWD